MHVQDYHSLKDIRLCCRQTLMERLRREAHDGQVEQEEAATKHLTPSDVEENQEEDDSDAAREYWDEHWEAELRRHLRERSCAASQEDAREAAEAEGLRTNSMPPSALVPSGEEGMSGPEKRSTPEQSWWSWWADAADEPAGVDRLLTEDGGVRKRTIRSGTGDPTARDCTVIGAFLPSLFALDEGLSSR